MENVKNLTKKLSVFKIILKNTFILSGFLPAHYLLFWSVYLLFGPLFFGEIENFRFDRETITFYGSLIIGTFGYFGLLLSMIPKRDNKFFIGIKILFLIFGIIGFCVFSTQDDHHLDDFLETFFNTLFTFDWFLGYWPNVVALVLIIYYLIKFIKVLRQKN